MNWLYSVLSLFKRRETAEELLADPKVRLKMIEAALAARELQGRGLQICIALAALPAGDRGQHALRVRFFKDGNVIGWKKRELADADIIRGRRAARDMMTPLCTSTNLFVFRHLACQPAREVWYPLEGQNVAFHVALISELTGLAISEFL